MFANFIKDVRPLPVSVYAGSGQAFSREVGGEEICVLLGLNKDQSSLFGIALSVLHQLLQLGPLVKFGNLVEHLFNRVSS